MLVNVKLYLDNQRQKTLNNRQIEKVISHLENFARKYTSIFHEGLCLLGSSTIMILEVWNRVAAATDYTEVLLTAEHDNINIHYLYKSI